MNRCWMLLCLALAVGACQAGLDGAAPGAATDEASTASELSGPDCTPGGNFCNAPAAKWVYWKGASPPLAGAGQSYHAFEHAQNPSVTFVVLADVSAGKLVWATYVTSAQEREALLNKVWGRGPIDIVRPPPPPPPVGTESLILERALRYQQLTAEASAAVLQCN